MKGVPFRRSSNGMEAEPRDVDIFKPTRRMENHRASLEPVDLFKSQLARGAPIEAARYEVLRCLVAPCHFRQDGIS